jgi:HK97 family phage major capsid protein
MDTSGVAMAKTINAIGESFEEFKKTNDERIAAEKKGRDSLAAELNEKLDRVNASLTEATKAKTELEAEQKFQRERLEMIEAKASRPGKTDLDIVKDEYKATWFDWIRSKGQSSSLETKLHDLQRKDVTIASAAGGGYAVPEEISRMIGELQLRYSPVRSLVKVVSVGTSDYKELIDLNGATSGWVGESDSRTATSTSTLREVAPTHGELYAYPQASEWSLDDMFFNVEQWIAESVARSFAQAEATAVISGNGTNKPTGMLNTTPVTTADTASPKRAAAAYQYVLGADNSPAAIDADTLIDMFYTLNSAYRGNATWIMNSLTVAQVRKLKDSQNQYLWQPSLQAGQPDMLLAKPVSVWEQMSDPLGGNFPLAFGDFKQGYLLTDRTGLRITRDNVTNVGYVRFYVRRREGGMVSNNDAVKWLKLL